MSKVSLKFIAEKCGVSTATVSRVINKNGRYSKETEQRVLEAIEKYGYEVNYIARGLRMNRSHTIGVLVPDLLNEFFANIVQTLEKQFFDYGYSLFICNTNRDEKKELQYLKLLEAKQVDGVIVISGDRPFSLENVKRNIPVVCIDRNPQEKGAVVVRSDHMGGSFEATKLMKKNYDYLIFVSHRKESPTSNLRKKGFLRALEDEAFDNYSIFEYVDLYSESLFIKNIIAKVKQFTKQGQKVGLVVTNDYLSIRLLGALIDEGLNIPLEAGIIGFDNISMSSCIRPALTTVSQDMMALATRTAEVLYNMIEKQDSFDSLEIKIPTKIIIRDTVI